MERPRVGVVHGDAMKVLAIFGGYRYHKTVQTLPYSRLEYRVLLTGRRNRWLHLPPPVRLLLLLPLALWSIIKVYVNRRALRVAREFQPDLIYTNSGTATQADVRAITTRMGTPLVVRLGGHIHDEERENLSVNGVSSLFTKPIYRRHYKLSYAMLDRAAHVVTVSEDMADRLAAESARPRESISAITVPCNIERFNLPKAPGTRRLLIVTNLTFAAKLKALLDFLPALDEHDDVKIVAPGRYHKALTQATRHPVEDYIENIEREYQKAAVFCYFSYLDGCPNVILEAWASHTPIVVNRHPWSEELIQHNLTGLLADSPTDAATYINALLDSPQLRAEFAENGFKYVCTHHSVQAAGAHLGEVLRGALSQAKETG